jgi:lysophospholipase L1-like esterase
MNEMNIERRFAEIGKAWFEFTTKARLASFKELNQRAQKEGIVFCGDSITEGFPIYEMLQCNKPMYNRGISGDSTTGVLDKLKDEVFDLIPQKVFLLIGTNDLGEGTQPAEVVGKIEDICRSIKQTVPEVELFVESIYPVNDNEFVNAAPMPIIGLRTNETIQLTNNGIKEIATNMKLTYIDLYSKLVDKKGKLNKNYSYDGLHLNAKGYYIVSEELQKYL